MQNNHDKKKLETDIAIVGGGLVGQALALALSPYVGEIALIEREDIPTMGEANFDARAMALAYNGICILKGLGLWDKLRLDCEPIYQVHVSNKGLPGAVRLDRTQVRKPCLGAICSFPRLHNVFYDALKQIENVNVISPAEVKSFSDEEKKLEVISKLEGHLSIKSKLIIACDGARSKIRETLKIESDHTDYHADAMVCNIELMRSHNNWAYERFYDEGIIAMLPMTNQRAACVFTFDRTKKAQIAAMDDQAMCAYLQNLFGYRLGAFKRIGRRDFFPLHLVMAKRTFSGNTLLFGNALHFLHPVAGQGFNLSLRDIAVLTDLVKTHGITDDNKNLLENFEKLREKDHQRTAKISDGLVTLFGHPNVLVKAFRSIGLHLTEHSLLSKSLINKVMMGDMIQLPTLAKQRVNLWEI